jgi:hypothetical protein
MKYTKVLNFRMALIRTTVSRAPPRKQATAMANPSDVIDWDEAMEQCGDDEEFLRELLADLRGETDAQLIKIDETIKVSLMSVQCSSQSTYKGEDDHDNVLVVVLMHACLSLLFCRIQRTIPFIK